MGKNETFHPKQRFLHKTPCSKPLFQISKHKKWQQQFLAMPIFQHFQNYRQKFEQLPDLFLKNPMVFAISKTDVEKKQSPLHISPKSDTVFKKQQTSNLPIHLQDKVDRLLDHP